VFAAVPGFRTAKLSFGVSASAPSANGSSVLEICGSGCLADGRAERAGAIRETSPVKTSVRYSGAAGEFMRRGNPFDLTEQVLWLRFDVVTEVDGEQY
jgi:hypothetical protein